MRSAGRPRSPGTDALQIVDGKPAEYWANADSLLFLRRLGTLEVPVQE